ncbi:MAG TPA: RMD1 family protein [Terriglobia bacterium]|nr:RMD1 family protein [Terriglobia bacterium]
MSSQIAFSGDTVTARAVLLGERIDLKGMESTHRLGISPLLISTGETSCAALFRYGVVVLFGMNPLQEVSFLNQLIPLVGQPYGKREIEETLLRMNSEAEEQLETNLIQVREFTPERLQIIADILAKSVTLGYYEAGIAGVFDRIEPFAVGLQQKGEAWPKGRELIGYIGDTLLIQHKMVARVEVADKPELLWERPELGKLYARLEDEYELVERHVALERKLALLARTVETLLDLLQNKRSLRVEWYIVILIVAELLLTLYQLFIKH